jgi:heme/copper-type cytochrome/quinol oxidase subunit 2
VRRRGLLGPGLALALLVGAAPAEPEIAVKITKQGFQPSRITVQRGETTRLVLSAAEGEHCFALEAFRVEKRVVPGRPTRLDLTPERTGVFPFYCCLESGEAAKIERGELTVTE